MSQQQDKEAKTVLIVYAHYADTSFNAALLKTAKGSLEKCGHRVIVTDLYKNDFNPVMGQGDFVDHVDNRRQEGHFDYERAAGAAWDEGRLAPDVVAQQELIWSADLIIFQFPLQWMSWPAILKGWLERVLTNKFAYSNGCYFDRAHLQGKKALLSFTTGGGPGYFTNIGISGQLDTITWPMHCALRFVGLDVLRPQVSFAPGSRSYQRRVQMLEDWEHRLQTVFDEEPLFFFKMQDFEPPDGDPAEAMVLKKSITRNGHRTVGQNLGKPLPPPLFASSSGSRGSNIERNVHDDAQKIEGVD